MKKESVILEIRAAEGGEDAKLLVSEMAAIYRKAAIVYNFQIETKQ